MSLRVEEAEDRATGGTTAYYGHWVDDISTVYCSMFKRVNYRFRRGREGWDRGYWDREGGQMQ